MTPLDAQGKPPASAPSPRPGRALDTLSAMLLAVAAILVFTAAAPALLRPAGLGSDRSPPASAHGGSPTSPHGVAPILGDDDLDEAAPGTTDEHPFGMAPPRAEGPLQGDEPGEARPGPGASLRAATVRRRTKLLLRAEDDAAETGEVAAGDSVYVVKEQGAWALVMRSGPDGMAMGWARKSQLAIR